MSGSQEKAYLPAVQDGETAEVHKKICQALEKSMEKIEFLDKRVDFQGGKSSDVLKRMLQWFEEFDFEQGGSNQLLQDFFELFEHFCNSPVLQGCSFEDKHLQWKQLLAAARIQATEVQMWKHLELKLQLRQLELTVLMGGSKKELKDIEDLKTKIVKKLEDSILPVLENCFRPEIEKLIQGVDLDTVDPGFLKPGTFQLHVSKVSFKNFVAYLEMWQKIKIFSEKDAADILQKPTAIEELQMYPQPAAEFQSLVKTDAEFLKLFKLE
jgi:hypothetical protein